MLKEHLTCREQTENMARFSEVDEEQYVTLTSREEVFDDSRLKKLSLCLKDTRTIWIAPAVLLVLMLAGAIVGPVYHYHSGQLEPQKEIGLFLLD